MSRLLSSRQKSLLQSPFVPIRIAPLAICSAEIGLEVPIPMFPSLFTTNFATPEAEAANIFWLPVSFKIVRAFPTAAPETLSLPIGDVVPIPTFPPPACSVRFLNVPLPPFSASILKIEFEESGYIAKRS